MKLPDSDFLSAPLGLLTLLHLLTFALHLAAMNVLLGGVLIALGAAARGRWSDLDLAGLGRWLPSAMAATVTLGVAPLLFLQMVYPRQVYAAAIVSGWWWLLVPAAAMAAYSALYRSSLGAERSGRVSPPALALATVALLYISLAYSAVFSLAEQPQLIRALHAGDATGWVWNPPSAEGLLRWLHMLTGALAVGGFCVAWLGRDRPPVFATGRACFLWGMLAAALAGSAYLVALRPILRAFMHTPAIWALTLAIFCSAAALHLFLKRRFAVASALLFASLFGMVYARHTVRLLKLAGSFDPAAWRIAPQWPVVGLFLLCFGAMLAALGWLLRVAAKDPA